MWCPSRFLFGPLIIYSVLRQTHHFSSVHCYADDTQVYISFCPNDRLDQLNAGELLVSCITDISARMLHDNFKLNDEKTELLIIGAPQQLEKVAVSLIFAQVTQTFTLCLSLGTLACG